jgi:hypothetical protein
MQQTTAGNALQIYLSTAFDGTQTWNAQPGNPPYASGTTDVVGCGAHLSAGPFSNYYFFSDSSDDHIVVVVEVTPGLYVHFGWGPMLSKNGTWTGGAYFFASSSGSQASFPVTGANAPGYTSSSYCPGAHEDFSSFAAGFVLCDSDSFTGLWIGISDTALLAGGYTGRNGASMVYGGASITPSIPRYSSTAPTVVPPEFQWEQTSQQDGRANLLPVVWWVGRDGSSGQSGGFAPIGAIPTVFSTTGAGNGFAPAEDYAIGGETYTMFPNFAVLKVV